MSNRVVNIQKSLFKYIVEVVEDRSSFSNKDDPSHLFDLKKTRQRGQTRVSYRNSVAHCVAERNAIFTVISARFVAHIPLPLAPNLRLKVSFLAHQQCGILGAIKV